MLRRRIGAQAGQPSDKATVGPVDRVRGERERVELRGLNRIDVQSQS